MTLIGIDRDAPTLTPVNEDGDLVAETFRDETVLDDGAPFFVVDLTDDPHAPRIVYAREHALELARWTVEPGALR